MQFNYKVAKYLETIHTNNHRREFVQIAQTPSNCDIYIMVYKLNKGTPGRRAAMYYTSLRPLSRNLLMM